MEVDKSQTTKSTQEHERDLAVAYEPTPREKAAMEAYRQRKNKTPRIKASSTKAGITLSLKHPDQGYGHVLLMEAFGTVENDFLCELLVELSRAVSEGPQANEQRLNFMVAVIKGIKPQDQLETMLAAQMAAIHSLTMEFAGRLARAGDLAWCDNAERTLNKLARTFAVQVEALKRYRTGGAQTVRVEHVTVNSGGQAIVGNVAHGGPGEPTK